MIVLRAFQRNQCGEISAHLTALRQEDKSIMLNLGSRLFFTKISSDFVSYVCDAFPAQTATVGRTKTVFLELKTVEVAGSVFLKLLAASWLLAVWLCGCR